MTTLAGFYYLAFYVLGLAFANVWNGSVCLQTLCRLTTYLRSLSDFPDSTMNTATIVILIATFEFSRFALLTTALGNQTFECSRPRCLTQGVPKDCTATAILTELKKFLCIPEQTYVKYRSVGLS